MYDTILVPVDGSECALRAVREARTIAARYEATIHLLNVVDTRSYGAPMESLEEASARLESALVEYGEDALDEAAALLDAPETAQVHDVPAVGIRRHAEEVDADLIVLGTHGRTGLDRFLLGSVAERVVRRSEVPVLTVREETAEDPYERILLPTDGNENAEVAGEHAIDLAARFDAALHVVSVVDLQSAGGYFDAGGLSAEFVDRLESRAREATDRLAERASEAGVEVETVVESGSPREELLEYVDAEGIDLVAMGTHGRSGVKRALLGSVTESVVRRATSPVLTVRLTGD